MFAEDIKAYAISLPNKPNHNSLQKKFISGVTQTVQKYLSKKTFLWHIGKSNNSIINKEEIKIYNSIIIIIQNLGIIF